jgi:predicted Zn-dependent protease
VCYSRFSIWSANIKYRISDVILARLLSDKHAIVNLSVNNPFCRVMFGADFDLKLVEIQFLLMMDESRQNTQELVKRFEGMLKRDESFFFDVEEFEQITDYYFHKGKNKSALEVIELASSQHPMSAIFPIKRAQYLTAYDKMDEAIRELDKAAALEPNSYDMLVARSHIFAKQGKHSRAVSLLKKALTAAEEPADVHALLAEQYQYIGNNEES